MGKLNTPIFWLLIFAATSCKTGKSAPPQDMPIFSVVALEGFKTVYAGVLNYITIVIPNAKEITVRGKGLKKVDDLGHYTIVPDHDDKIISIDIEATMTNGQLFRDTRIFEVRRIKSFALSLNGKSGQVVMSKEEILNGKFAINTFDFIFDIGLQIKGFTVRFVGHEPIIVTGNQLNEIAKLYLEKAKSGDQITFYDILTTGPGEVRMPLLVEIR